MAKQLSKGFSTKARIFGMSFNTAVVAMAFSNTMKLVQSDNSSHNNPGTVGSVYSQ